MVHIAWNKTIPEINFAHNQSNGKVESGQNNIVHEVWNGMLWPCYASIFLFYFVLQNDVSKYCIITNTLVLSLL